ncbi:MAG TPA: hypothetical protein VL752_16425 [Acidisoma sp.]|uniref:hypothetical protein n=1 Tax=Acidisoma sp. TaxID=1872115 RepID=UPI002D08B015|nr:hypothetical protein [Acidisoma sp.]HTI02537.1 hypothetical protein [Acidisoma sp.]
MLLAAQNKALLVSTGRVLLSNLGTSSGGGSGGSGGSGGGGSFTGPTPAAIPGLTGWWDAGSAASWNAVVTGLADQSGSAQTITPYHYYTGSGVTPAALLTTPRLNGLLGGLGAPIAPSGTYSPTLDPDTGLQIPALSLSPDIAWTHMLVWSRPNRRQGTYYVNANPVALITLGGSVVLSLSSTGNTLTLFPSGANVVLSSNMTRRHSHAVILRNTPGTGIDVWLNGTQVTTAVPNLLPAGVTGPVTLMHDMTLQGAAQLWFHEMATWPRALDAADMATLIACGGRWSLGARRGVSLLVMGQSNSSYFVASGGAAAMARGLAWYLGALAGNVIFQPSGTYLSPTRYTQVNGHPISNSTAPLFPPGTANGTFLTNPGDGSDPATWALGPDGLAVQAYLTGTSAIPTAEDLADIAALVWPWTEQDSTAPYSQKTLYAGTVKQLAALTRGMLGRTAANLPLLMWNAIPYETDAGVQMVREAIADIAADTTQNLGIFAAQTADSIPLGASYDATTGAWSGGDATHRDETDELAFGLRGAHTAARAALAAGFGDTLTAIPTGMPLSGPRIVQANVQSATQITVEIAHDQGTDILLPLQAAAGVGWAVMDGGSVASPGPIVTATAAARLDATHLALTLSQPLTQPAANCLLFYPYGSTQIGRGDAVTDNVSTIGWPTGWNMAGDLGSAWSVNMPLQATSYGIALTATSA